MVSGGAPGPSFPKNSKMKSIVRILPAASFILGASAPAATVAYRNLILGDSPLVYYEFDETSGTTAANSASTGQTYTGTFDTSGGAINVGLPSFAQGGTAYLLGGGFVAAASALTSSLDEWSVEAWVNYSVGSSSNFLSNDQGGWNDDVLIGVGAENNMIPSGTVGLVHQGNPGTTRETVSFAIDPGRWYHVGITGSESAGELMLYVDGVLVDTNKVLTNGATFNGAGGFGEAPNLTIGAARPNRADPAYRPYGGLLDELAIYDFVLTESDFEARANFIPEPSSALLGGLGGLVFLRRRRPVRTGKENFDPSRAQLSMPETV